MGIDEDNKDLNIWLWIMIPKWIKVHCHRFYLICIDVVKVLKKINAKGEQEHIQQLVKAHIQFVYAVIY